jgi:hypothetical protein
MIKQMRQRFQRVRPAAAATIGLVPVAILLAACGSAAAGPPPSPAGQATVPLATSIVAGDGTSYAIVEMGGSAAQEENFWQLFSRPAGASGWQLATPLGVADNGGLVAAATGATSMVTGFRPSQDLLFSPLASTTDSGANWSAASPLPGGLANVPAALAAGPDGQLIALTTAGKVLEQASPQANWTTLATTRQLAATPAGRTCGLTGLTAAAFGPGGSPVLAGTCSGGRSAGVFISADGSWQLNGPALASRDSTSVLSLATTGSVTTAVVRAGAGASARLVAAWLGASGQWTTSAALTVGPAQVLSASIWPGGAVGVVLAGGRAAVLSGPTASWQRLSGLPARTATLAPQPGGRTEALSANGGTFQAWELSSGRWQLAQTVKVAIPYGSSS